LRRRSADARGRRRPVNESDRPALLGSPRAQGGAAHFVSQGEDVAREPREQLAEPSITSSGSTVDNGLRSTKLFHQHDKTEEEIKLHERAE
jgi:hypothetical protein